MDTLEYKDFIGSVNFSAEDDVFYGKIEGISSLVTFEGNSVASLKKAFRKAVADYIELCRAKGINPQKTYSGILNIRLSSETHRKAAMHSTKRGTTLNGFIKTAIENELKSSQL